MSKKEEQQENKFDGRAKWLASIGAVDIGVREIVEMVEAIFHIEDLYELSKRNTFLALNFFQLICNIDYVIFVGMCHDPKQGIQPAGETNIGAEIASILVGTGAPFPNTIEGVLLAISHCFKIQCAAVMAMVTTTTLSDFMQGTGIASVVSDALNALLTGAQGLTNLGKSAGEALPLLAGADSGQQAMNALNSADVGGRLKALEDRTKILPEVEALGTDKEIAARTQKLMNYYRRERARLKKQQP